MKSLYYHSTRSKEEKLTFSQAVIKGLAQDGGLYIPETWPDFDFSSQEWLGLSYQELSLKVIAPFMPEIKSDDLSKALNSAYDSKFSDPKIIPLKPVGDVHVLELFHGRTLAFKDMALSLLPHLIQLAQKSSTDVQKEIVILTATSGDTGKAALEAFSGVSGTRIFVFYPTDGVSDIQKRQMATQTGENVHVYGIRGNFDDAQQAVKVIFSDQVLRKSLEALGKVFSSANSMNVGRLIPQIAYYVGAYFELVKTGEITQGQAVNVAIPTGNFGNILAAYYAKKMGLPIGKLICASNANTVLTDFFNEGIYQKDRVFHTTHSPSMDIVVSSNLERLLFEVSKGDCGTVANWMTALQEKGKYALDAGQRSILKDFYAGACSDEKTLETIREVYQTEKYVADPHTAVALAVEKEYRLKTGDVTKCIVVSTASTFKFSESVLKALDEKVLWSDCTEVERLNALSNIMYEALPGPLSEVLSAPILHLEICDKTAIQSVVERVLGL